MIRSLAALVAGFFVVVFLALSADALLHAIWPSAVGPDLKAISVTTLLASLLGTALAQVVGGYMTAVIAPRRPQLHATLLGVIGFALGLLTTLRSTQVAPTWYNITTLALTIPATALGGALRVRRILQRPAAGA